MKHSASDILNSFETSPFGLRTGFFLLALMTLLFSSPYLFAATLTVENGCTLIDAINAANSDLAVGGCAAGSGADTIELTGDVILESPHAEFSLPGDNGLPRISSDVTIAGGDFKIERAINAMSFRIFEVLSDGTLNLENVTLSSGDSPLKTLPSNSGSGGAVYNLGTLSLINSHLANNSSFFGGGIFSTGTATLTDSTVTNNIGRFTGGGIFSTGTATLTNSTVADNSGPRQYGGIVTSGGRLILNGCKVLRNFGPFGAIGSFSSPGHVTVTNSTVSDNWGGVSGAAGSVLVLTGTTVSGSQDSALSLSESTATVNNSTLSSSGGVASATVNFHGSLNDATFNNSTVFSSTRKAFDGSANLVLSNTIVAGGTDQMSHCSVNDPIGGFDGTLGPECSDDASSSDNAPQWIAGHDTGTALDFDGADNAVFVPQKPALGRLTSLTVAAWVRDTEDSGYRAIVDMRDKSTDGYNLYLVPPSTPFLRINGSHLTGHTNVSDGDWHLVIGTYDGTTLSLYVDGMLDYSAMGASNESIDVTARLLLGQHFQPNSNHNFGGDLSQTKIWNRALSAVEVAELYTSTR